jgi:YD repeat-containing protein
MSRATLVLVVLLGLSACAEPHAGGLLDETPAHGRAAASLWDGVSGVCAITEEWHRGDEISGPYTSTYATDRLGRLVWVARANVSGPPDLTFYERSCTRRDRFILRYLDADGVVHGQDVYEGGRLVLSQDGDAPADVWTYDEEGRLLSFDSMMSQLRWQYDAAGHVVSFYHREEDSGSSSRELAWDGDRLVQDRWRYGDDPWFVRDWVAHDGDLPVRGEVVELDADGQRHVSVTWWTWADGRPTAWGSGESGEARRTWTWDGDLLVEETDSTYVSRWTYDELDRVVLFERIAPATGNTIRIEYRWEGHQLAERIYDTGSDLQRTTWRGTCPPVSDHRRGRPGAELPWILPPKVPTAGPW